MIMPGIMSEGSNGGFDPNCEARRGSRSPHPDAGDLLQSLTGSQPRPERECCRFSEHSVEPVWRSAGAEYRQRENTLPATTQHPVRPAIGRGPPPDTSGNCDCDTSCKRWRNVRNRNTAHGHPRRLCGNYECRRRLSSVRGRGPAPTKPERYLRKCGRHRPVPADAHSFLRWIDSGRLDDVERVQELQWAAGRAHPGIGAAQIAGTCLQLCMAEQNLNGAEIDARFQQVSGEGVSQGVRMNRFGDTGFLGGLPAG